MRNGAVLVLGLLAIDVPALAENGVFKCTGADGVIVYQGAPCRVQQQQVTLVEPRKREPEPVVGEAAKSGTDADARRVAPVGDELIPGMSDTKVLNMRGWGRPQRIERSRAKDGWREEWTYVSRNDGTARLVSFINGKVEGVSAQDALQVARARQETQLLADQTRRSIDSLQAVRAQTRDESQRTERSFARAEIAPAIATAEPPRRAIAAPERRNASGLQPEDPGVDHAARAAAAIARIEEARREPVQMIRPEPPLRAPEQAVPQPQPLPLPIVRPEPSWTPEPAVVPSETIVQSSAGRQFAPSQDVVAQ